MNTNRCNTCAHYRQHYALDDRRIFRVYCGHCTFLKVKRRKPDTEACEHYIPSAPDETAFASKEYLSKELLSYVLGLEILPEIRDMEDEAESR